MTEQTQQVEETQDAEQERCKGCSGTGGYDTPATFAMDGVTGSGRRRVVCMFCGGSGRVPAEARRFEVSE